MAKIRTSFVANSSSSSFIIGVKNFKQLDGYDELPSWAKKYIDKTLNCIKDNTPYSTKEELDAYIMYNYGYGESLETFLKDDEYFESNYYLPMLEAVLSGYKVYDITVDHDESTLESFFEELPRKDDGSGMYLINCNN